MDLYEITFKMSLEKGSNIDGKFVPYESPEDWDWKSILDLLPEEEVTVITCKKIGTK